MAALTNRPATIKAAYDSLIDTHLTELVSGKAAHMLEIEDFARLLFIHPTHLTNTLRTFCGMSACGIYQLKILQTAKCLLSDERRSIRDIALLLTFDPSQFSKWFRRIGGMTPKAYRASLKGHNC